jgi:hypothetical protein
MNGGISKRKRRSSYTAVRLKIEQAQLVAADGGFGVVFSALQEGRGWWFARRDSG